MQIVAGRKAKPALAFVLPPRLDGLEKLIPVTYSGRQYRYHPAAGLTGVVPKVYGVLLAELVSQHRPSGEDEPSRITVTSFER